MSFGAIGGGGGGGGAAALVADAINDGTTTVAPSQNAVFDALALKIANPGGSNDDFLQRKAGVYTNRTIAQVKTDLGVVTPTSFLFNPDGTQAGNVYNDWGDLDAALQAAPGRRTVYLASETLDAFGRMVAEVPAGSYDWSAVGFSTASNSLAGATLRVGDGVTITNMDGLRLEGLVTLEFVNDAGPVATLPASTRWGITLDLGTIVAKGDAVPISMPNASSFIGFILDNEAGLIRGTTPQGNTEGTQAIVNSADASNGIFVTMGLKSWATDNLFTGTVGFFAYRCGSTSVNPATITNAGLTVSYNGSALITYAANLAYDNTDSGLAAGNVQAAIDEIVVSAGGGGAAALVADAINDGVTTVAPSQNAVFDALALKIPNPGGANDDFLQRKAGAWTNRTRAQVLTDLIAAAGTPTGSKFIRDDGTLAAAGGGVAPFFINWDSVGGVFGRGVPGVIVSDGNNTTNSGNWSTSRTVGTYFKVEAPISLITMEATVVTLESGKTFRMAIASVDNNGQPVTVLYDSGDISTTTSGVKVATPASPITLAPGWYVRLFRSNTTATCTWRAGEERSNHGNAGWGASNPLRMAQMTSGSYGAFSTPPIFNYAVGTSGLTAPLMMLTWSVI